MLEMSSLQVTVKRSRGKEQQEETEKQHHVIVTENNVFDINIFLSFLLVLSMFQQ